MPFPPDYPQPFNRAPNHEKPINLKPELRVTSTVSLSLGQDGKPSEIVNSATLKSPTKTRIMRLTDQQDKPNGSFEYDWQPIDGGHEVEIARFGKIDGSDNSLRLTAHPRYPYLLGNSIMILTKDHAGKVSVSFHWTPRSGFEMPRPTTIDFSNSKVIALEPLGPSGGDMMSIYSRDLVQYRLGFDQELSARITQREYDDPTALATFLIKTNLIQADAKKVQGVNLHFIEDVSDMPSSAVPNYLPSLVGDAYGIDPGDVGAGHTMMGNLRADMEIAQIPNIIPVINFNAGIWGPPDQEGNRILIGGGVHYDYIGSPNRSNHSIESGRALMDSLEKRGIHTIGTDSAINQGASWGGSPREVIVVDDREQNNVLTPAYKDLLPRVARETSIEGVLRTVTEFVGEKINYDEQAVSNLIISQGKPLNADVEMSLSDFVSKGIGVCRHMALFEAYLIERLIRENRLGNSSSFNVSYDRNHINGYGGHGFVRFVDKRNPNHHVRWISDPTNYRAATLYSSGRGVGTIHEAQSWGIWDYRRPNEIIQAQNT